MRQSGLSTASVNTLKLQDGLGFVGVKDRASSNYSRQGNPNLLGFAPAGQSRFANPDITHKQHPPGPDLAPVILNIPKSNVSVIDMATGSHNQTTNSELAGGSEPIAQKPTSPHPKLSKFQKAIKSGLMFTRKKSFLEEAQQKSQPNPIFEMLSKPSPPKPIAVADIVDRHKIYIPEPKTMTLSQVQSAEPSFIHSRANSTISRASKTHRTTNNKHPGIFSRHGRAASTTHTTDRPSDTLFDPHTGNDGRSLAQKRQAYLALAAVMESQFNMDVAAVNSKPHQLPPDNMSRKPVTTQPSGEDFPQSPRMVNFAADVATPRHGSGFFQPVTLPTTTTATSDQQGGGNKRDESTTRIGGTSGVSMQQRVRQLMRKKSVLLVGHQENLTEQEEKKRQIEKRYKHFKTFKNLAGEPLELPKFLQNQEDDQVYEKSRVMRRKNSFRGTDSQRSIMRAGSSKDIQDSLIPNSSRIVDQTLVNQMEEQNRAGKPKDARDPSLRLKENLNYNLVNSQVYQEWCTNKGKETLKELKEKITRNKSLEVITCEKVKIKPTRPIELNATELEKAFQHNQRKMEDLSKIRSFQKTVAQTLYDQLDHRSKQLATAMRRRIEVPAAVQTLLSSESRELSMQTERRSSRQINAESTLSLLRSHPEPKFVARKRVNHHSHHPLGSNRKIELTQLQKEIWTDASRTKLNPDSSVPRLAVNSHNLRPIVKRGISIAGFTTRAMNERMSVLPINLPEEPMESVALDEEALKLEEIRFVEKIRSLRAKITEDPSTNTKPPSREEGHLVTVNYGNQTWLVVYGGIGCQVFTDIWFCPIHRVSMGWSNRDLVFSDFATVDNIGLFQSSFTPATHTPKPHIYLFGGYVRNPKSSAFDGPNHNLYCLDLESFVCSKMQSHSTLKPTHRRFHAAVYHEGNLYIIGGIDGRDEPVHDCWRFRPSNHSWTPFHMVLGSRFISEETSLSIHAHAAVSIPSSSKSNHSGKVAVLSPRSLCSEENSTVR